MAEPVGDPRDVEIEAIDLRDGRRLVVRPARAGDVKAVRSLYERLSAGDWRLRFFSAHVPPDSTIERWLTASDRGGSVLVAEVVDDGTEPLVVAEAGYALLENGDGEFAITVDPTWRGWMGPWLLDIVAEQAAANGVANLEADLMVRNRSMRALLDHRGHAVVDHPDWEHIKLVISTTGRTPGWPPHGPRPRVLAAAPRGNWKAEQEARAGGFDVRTCPGPDGPIADCPALDGRPCPLVEGADAVVIALPADDPRTGELVAAHRDRHPTLPIVLPRPPGPSGAPAPCETAAYVVEQIRSQLRALPDDAPTTDEDDTGADPGRT